MPTSPERTAGTEGSVPTQYLERKASLENDTRCERDRCLRESRYNKLTHNGKLKSAFVSTAISGNAEVLGNQQKSLDVGSCLWALQGEEVWHVHIG